VIGGMISSTLLTLVVVPAVYSLIERGPAPEARLLYEETPSSINAREAQRDNRKLQVDPAADLHGRPSKRDRRQLNRIGDS
jgi:hypothetical protein